MSLITHAKKEMERMWPEPDVMQDMVKTNVLELLKVFEKQGHSGSSASSGNSPATNRWAN